MISGVSSFLTTNAWKLAKRKRLVKVNHLFFFTLTTLCRDAVILLIDFAIFGFAIFAIFPISFLISYSGVAMFKAWGRDRCCLKRALRNRRTNPYVTFVGYKGRYLKCVNCTDNWFERGFLRNNSLNVTFCKFSRPHLLTVNLNESTDYFIWDTVDGKKQLNFTDWHLGQPDNHGHEGEGCGHYWAHHGLKWNDNRCRARLTYICEYKGTLGSSR